MRVIAGEFRSRRLQSMPGEEVRPTPDKLRETLFNILGASVEGSVFVDAYAGSGAVGIEALSRGARHAVFIEKNRKAANLVLSNLASLGIENRARVIVGSAALFLSDIRADIVFLDPPYPMGREYQAALDALGSSSPNLVVVQHSRRFEPGEKYGALRRTRVVKHGENVLSFFRPIESAGLSAEAS